MEQIPTSNVVKGLILSLIIVLLSIGLYFSGYQENTSAQYLVYGIFIGGIIWSCISYGKQSDGNVTFGNVFAHGFKVSAVVALAMVAFVLIFSALFPEMKEKTLEALREKMATNPKVTTDMIEQTVNIYTQWFRVIIVAGALFGYIFMGLIASLIGAALTKENQPVIENGYIARNTTYNEDESLPELCEWIQRIVNQQQYSYEILLVDDGSTDDSWNVIEKLREKNPLIKGIRFQRNYGKSAALNEGFKVAQGNVVITMDADMQDSPDEIPALYNMIMTDGYDIVSGWKKKRFDNTLTKNIPSKFFNWATRRVSNIPLHDFNCGLKAYKRKVVKSVEIYGEMHRYIPVLAKWAGFRKIGEKVVEHRARKYGTTKFGWERFVNGFLDLTSIMFVGKYGKRPMHFFGLLGTICFLLGFVVSLYLIIIKLVDPSTGLTNRPPFYIALTAMVIGTQLFLAGFLGELISRNSSNRNAYLIEKKLGID